ncbi:MAG: hypothetical protein ACXAEU_15415 [Candidatus Hodarchaeales archaeon]
MAEQDIDFSNFKHSLYFTLPITITIVLASILSLFTLYVYYPSKDPGEIDNIAPVQGEGVDAGLINAIIFISLAFIGGILLLYLLRKGQLSLVEKFFAIVMGYSAFVFTIFFLFPVYWVLIGQFLPESLMWFNMGLVNNYLALALVPALLSGTLVLCVLMIERFKSRNVHNILMVYLGSQLGALFGIHMPTLTVLLVLLGLSLYDVYAVFWGPLKAIFQPSSKKSQEINPAYNDYQEDKRTSVETYTGQRKDRLNINHTKQEENNVRATLKARVISLPVFQTNRISIGLGDFVFFSMLVSHAVMIGYFNAITSPFLLSFTGIVIGTYITFRILEKKDILPALPIPIFLGLIGFVAGYWVLGF